jgi:two-component system, OmpR family, phosphate regulon response regulator OmpR
MRAAFEQLAHVLVVDDDRRIRELLKAFLSKNGFRVTLAGDARAAREQMRGLSFDLLILDVMMPGENGLDLARSLRQSNGSVPILMLSALADASDRIEGLMSGSDDYLPKPFEPQELLLRVRNVLRRTSIPPFRQEEARFGSCVFNTKRGELRRGGELIKLTTRERELLRLLVQHTGLPVSREMMLSPGSEENARTVDVQINRLRQKIEDNPSNPIYLQTVRGTGYTLYID